MNNPIGIDAISFYSPRYYLDLATLAKVRGVDPSKFQVGLGQFQMAIISPLEDIVTMALEAASDVVVGHEEVIDLILFATESGFDFSKASGIYLQQLLKLNPYARVLEVKQACYGATGALQLAVDHIQLHPDRKALVLASDVAWYGFQSAGEVTQGAGAIAMLISANPRVAVVHAGKFYTESNADFYRPLGSEVPVVDGKLSIRSYRDVLKKVAPDKAFEYICFHQPFATMADKANEALKFPIKPEALQLVKQLGSVIGNIYNGSLFLSLISLLMYHKTTLAPQRIGMFSYGSGATGEFFELDLLASYSQGIHIQKFHDLVHHRLALTFEHYESFMHQFVAKEKSLDHLTNRSTLRPDQRYILKAIQAGHRIYEAIDTQGS
jgi:hydroxymethylglutaryl-CoA synthase